MFGLKLAVVKNNNIVKTGNYGLANIQDSIAVDSETVFSINSMNKAFTGVAVMQLVENGKLNLEDPISKYLDNLPNTWRNITVRQIVTHQSGLPEIWDSKGNILSENSETLFQKIKELLNDIKRNSFQGIGKPEALKHDLKGFWSRRITGEHRLVYKIEGTKGKNQTCCILQCRFHYD